MDELLLAALKAFAHVERLRIAGRLAERSYRLDALAAELGLPARLVLRHLGHLEAAGLVFGRGRPDPEYSLVTDRLIEVGRLLGRAEATAPVTEPGPDGQPLAPEDAKVLRAFVVDDRLVGIPAQEKRKQPVLRYLMARCFAEDRTYPEKEVNMRLALLHPDVASLRRYLVDYGYLTRDHGDYRRADPQPGP